MVFKPPVDLSVAVRKHHDPTVESQVCVICPRRKGKPTDKSSGTSPVALSLEFLRPLFKKPLTQVSEELGLSATAIKKACRRFGVPKWPFRTLTAKTSRNRTTFDVPSFAPSPQVHVSPLASHQSDGFRQNPSVVDDFKKLKEDAEMIKEVAALAAAREVDQTKIKTEGFAEQELSAARNLSLLSASGTAAPEVKLDLGDFQMQYIRAWQQQHASFGENQLKLVGMGDVPVPKSDGSDASISALSSLANRFLLPPPNPILAYPGLGGATQILCPIPLSAFNMGMFSGTQMGMPAGFPIFVPGMLPHSAPLPS